MSRESRRRLLRQARKELKGEGMTDGQVRLDGDAVALARVCIRLENALTDANTRLQQVANERQRAVEIAQAAIAERDALKAKYEPEDVAASEERPLEAVLDEAEMATAEALDAKDAAGEEG